MYRPLPIILALWLLTATGAAAQCLQQPMRVEYLPHLNIPRSGHTVFCTADGEVVAAGGHTSGFVLTPTAERFDGHQWHLMDMAYNHGFGFSATLASGKVIVAGGAEKDLGIGQTFGIEFYDPATHHFEGYGCLDSKRCYAAGLVMDSDRVVISGNWYHDDAIECFDGQRLSTPVKGVTAHRSVPYILRTARDNAIIFSTHDNYGNPLDSIVADRLHGEPFTVPLFREWRPLWFLVDQRSAQSFIGNETRGDYSYLVPVADAKGQVAIARTEGEAFSLLETDHPVPMQSRWGPVCYYSYIVADTLRHRAYLTGYGEKGNRRFYVLSIAYDETPATLTLYYSEPLDSVGFWQPVLMPDGNLLIAGGLADSNFNPAATTVLLCVCCPPDTETAADGHATRLPWVLGGAAVLLLITLLTARAWQKRHRQPEVLQEAATDGNDSLMQRIVRLMEEEKAYLNADIKLQHVADALATNRTYVSDSIKASGYSSFNQFVNSYRIRHAMQLLRQQPDIKLAHLSLSAGFDNETTFFRAFKATTGTTPKKWLMQQQNSQEEQ